MRALCHRRYSCLLGLAWAGGCHGLYACGGEPEPPSVTAPTLRPPALDGRKVADDAAAWARLMQVPVEGRLARSCLPSDLHHDMAAMGLVADGDDGYRRVLPAADALRWVPMDSPGLPDVDAIAIISIARHDVAEPYIYSTLRSLFASLPAQLEVNVVVGDDDDAYLAPDRLAQQLGAGPARHVHVWPAPAAWAAHLRGQVGVHARATWNYARALAGYGGRRGLLLLEDDIVWARQVAPALAVLLAPPAPPAISLYNFFCGLLPGGSSSREGPPRTLALAARAMPWPFSRTQAVFYRAALVEPLARYMQLRAQTHPYDIIVGNFLVEHDLSLGFAEPSMAQHTGRHTTGLGAFHTSRCFPDDYPPP